MMVNAQNNDQFTVSLCGCDSPILVWNNPLKGCLESWNPCPSMFIFLQKRHSESGMQLEPPAFVTTLGPWHGLQWAEETMQRDTVPLLVVYRYGGFVWLGNHQNISRALKLVRNQNMFPSASICFHLFPSCSWQNTCHLQGTSSVSITISDDKLLQNRGMCCMLHASTSRVGESLAGLPQSLLGWMILLFSAVTMKFIPLQAVTGLINAP